MHTQTPIQDQLLLAHGHVSIRSRGVTTVQTRTLLPSDTETRSPFPVTTVERTLADLSSLLHDRQLAGMTVAAVQRKIASVESLVRWIQDHPSAQVTAFKQVVERLRATTVDSVFEADVRAEISARGLPTPDPAPMIVGTKAGRFQIDVPWARFKTGIEVDGPAHLDPHRRDMDTVKDAELQMIGWAVIRLSAAQWAHDRDRWFDRLARVLSSRIASSEATSRGV